MSVAPQLLRVFLAVCWFSMALLAAFYLRRRRLSTLAYLGWGLLALLVPIVGPYLVIAARPGQPGAPVGSPGEESG